MKRLTHLISLVLLFATTLASSVIFAKNINLYDQPLDNAKVVGSVDLAAGIIPIYTPKDNTAWVKVADPRNGNVGWVKSADMSDKNGSTFTFSQEISSDQGNKPQSYQITVNGQPQKLAQPVLAKPQPQDMIQFIRDQQQKLLNSAQQMINNINQINQQQGTTAVPVIMPIVVAPAQTAPAANANAPTSTTTPQTTIKK